MLINPTSGKGRGGKNAPVAARRMRERGLKVSEISGGSAEESLDLARRAVEEGADALIACGGDGTVHLALQAVVNTDVPLGIIPVGTGDDNARTLQLPLNDASAAADTIADWNVRTIDTGYVEAGGISRHFLGVMSVGFDSQCNERANRMKWPSGQARYNLAILATLSVFKPISFTFTFDGVMETQDAMLIAIGNGISYGGGMKVCPGAKHDDGLLDVTILDAVGKITFLRAFPGVFKGTHVNEPYVQVRQIKVAKIDAPGQVVYADGERIGEVPATIEARPGSLKVLGPELV